MYDSVSPPLVSFARARNGFLNGYDTPRAFLERCIAIIEAREAEVQAFVTLDLESARRAADEATARYRAGRPLSAIDGCPVGVKDIINTADLPTQMNSPIYRGWRPGWDAACVYALRRCGAIIAGKTVTTEFACGDAGPTRNPFDLERTPGGSSSGSAAAVGSGMLPAGLGTQTRASIIRPASYCGAYGFKPSYRALNLAGVHPVSTTLDHLGVIAASLEDAWWIAVHIARVVGGSAELGLIEPLEPPSAARPRRMARLDTPGWAETDEASRAAFDDLLAAARRHGVEIISAAGNRHIAQLEAAVAQADAAAREIIAFELRSPIGSYRERHPDMLGPTVSTYLSTSDRMTVEDYGDRLRRRDALRACVAALRGDIDLFVTLASSGPAPRGLESTGSRSFVSPWTVVGGPSLSLPLLRVDGLPLGVQVMGYEKTDATLVGHAAWMVGALLGVVPGRVPRSSITEMESAEAFQGRMIEDRNRAG